MGGGWARGRERGVESGNSKVSLEQNLLAGDSREIVLLAGVQP